MVNQALLATAWLTICSMLQLTFRNPFSVTMTGQELPMGSFRWFSRPKGSLATINFSPLGGWFEHY